MSRSWVQDPITLELIEKHLYVQPETKSHFVFGDLQSFVSPLDGTVITDRRQYAEHCRKHNVVNAAEFSDAYLAKKAREREAEGTSRKDAQRRKEAIHEIINRHEQQQSS